MAGYWRVCMGGNKRCIRDSDAVLALNASPGWQALTGKGEIGRARAHEKGHARRGKLRLQHNDMSGNLCCDHLILLFLLKRLQYKGLQDKLQGLQS